MVWFKKKKVTSTSSTSMGAILEWPEAKVAIGYFDDGIVYSRHKSALGSYTFQNDNYQIEFDNKIIGSYSPSDTGGLIYIWENYPTGLQKVAEYWNGQEYIHPDDDRIQTVIFSGDPVGAAAAFIVLYFGYGSLDQATKNRFLK